MSPGSLASRRVPLGIFAVAVVLLITGAGYLYLREKFVEALIRRSITQTLEERFHSKVELADLRINVYPRVRVVGHNLSVRYHGRDDVPPLIQVESFSFSAGLFSWLGPIKHIPLLRVENMKISIPPSDKATVTSPEFKSSLPAAASRIVIDRVMCEHTEILILPRQSGKVPLDWEIHNLTLTSASASQPFTFHGALTNGKPVGEITTDGQFGPWNAEEPGNTPVSGQYAFTDANLNPLPGIGGILSSTGKYTGVLGQLEVEGVTDTPDFSLDATGTPVPLHTEFSATVNGTNGDTQLHPVNALLGKSLIVAEGSVMGVPNASGHLITIEATVPNGRIQDFLKLATHSEKPIMTGPVKITAKLIIPPGKEQVFDKISLDGQFGVQGANWSSPPVREKLESLSRHGLGKPEAEDVGSSVSDFQGNFFIRQGVLHFRKLTFGVEGVAVDVAGTYSLRQGALDLAGHLTLQSKLSQTVTGTKSFLLKAFDPFFAKKGAGTVLPIRISGTRENPVFTVTVFHKSFEKPFKTENAKSR